jgi:NAD(P)-dependent dehydrogenase (short-subunit alcohol dehydrogenase family)
VEASGGALRGAEKSSSGTIYTMRPGSARNDAQVDHTVATNLVGSIQLIRSALPHLGSQGSGRIIQISSRGGRSRSRELDARPRPTLRRTAS